jgi:hypothetical protein
VYLTFAPKSQWRRCAKFRKNAPALNHRGQHPEISSHPEQSAARGGEKISAHAQDRREHEQPRGSAKKSGQSDMPEMPMSTPKGKKSRKGSSRRSSKKGGFAERSAMDGI